jgi:tRNA(adenine34) deaminase
MGAAMSNLVNQSVLDALRDATLAALRANEVPIAACVLKDGQLVSLAHNRTVTDSDPSAHAEILALREAGRLIGNYRLTNAQLISTVEPCAMCAGAAMHARVASVVFGLHDPKFGACGSVLDLFANAHLNHHVKHVEQSAMLAQISRDAMQSFFEMKRNRPKVPAFTVSSTSWAERVDREALTKIRFDVFVHEQSVPADSEIDADDPLSEHAVARMNKDGMAIATGRLLPNGHIGRMAVLKAYRGTGAGMAILRHLMARAQAKGFSFVELSAQTHAIPFYERAGFVAYGEEYLDCDIPHRMMRHSFQST